MCAACFMAVVTAVLKVIYSMQAFLLQGDRLQHIVDLRNMQDYTCILNLCRCDRFQYNDAVI